MKGFGIWRWSDLLNVFDPAYFHENLLFICGWRHSIDSVDLRVRVKLNVKKVKLSLCFFFFFD